tara:strand:+ start:722 stop:1714 length:993 start_codon:yes stop_codon:yes gene_type:complete
MEFFNKKEDVIDLQLTQFGRMLFSKGKFNPVYYSFFDDNIMYDSAKASFDEIQNRSEERIRESQILQPQISFSSLEKDFSKNYSLILSGQEKAGSVDLQRTPEKLYALPQPIGTSDINSEYSPSWSVQFLNGALSGSANNISLTDKDGGAHVLQIPQLEVDLKIEIANTDAVKDLNLDELEDASALSNIVVLSKEGDIYILLKISEKNGVFQKKNFDIEIFEIEEDNQDDVIVEVLRPLAFSKPEEITSELSFFEHSTPSDDKNYVGYYFDILVDDEISDEILCKKDPVNEKMGVYADTRTENCQEILDRKKKKTFDIYEEEADAPGEVC